MSAQTANTSKETSKTVIHFDLADVLSPDQVERFQESADEADAPNLTEHFLDLTLRLPAPKVA